MPLELPLSARRGIVEPLVPSLQVGGVTGIAGVTLGAVYGLFKSPHPVSFASAAGITSFLYGTSTFYFRASLLATQSGARTHRSELAASGAAGALTGAISGATHRSIYAILRTGGLLGLLGIASQAGYHAFVLPPKEPRIPRSFVDRIAGILPFRSIPDAEYEGILNGRIAQIDAEVGILNERIANLRRQSSASDRSEP